MDWPVFLEAVMVICFGLSWPASLVRSWRSHSTKGKSVLFLFMIAAGYASGIIWKFLEYRNTGVIKYPTFFYAVNLLMVLLDIALYFRNRRMESRTKGEKHVSLS